MPDLTPVQLGDAHVQAHNDERLEINAKVSKTSVSPDITMSANSNEFIPTQKAVKTYVDNNASGGGGGFSGYVRNESDEGIYYMGVSKTDDESASTWDILRVDVTKSPVESKHSDGKVAWDDRTTAIYV